MGLYATSNIIVQFYMPEYPDITIYIERLETLVNGCPLEQIRFASPFFLRTAEPPIKTIHGATVCGIERLGKRIVLIFDRERFLVIHLMVAGRLHWRKKACKVPVKLGLAVFDFPASNETNYCPTCQTGGKLLADRAISRLLKKDWPRTLEELEVRNQKLTR